jgi:hypothetical protein
MPVPAFKAEEFKRFSEWYYAPSEDSLKINFPTQVAIAKHLNISQALATKWNRRLSDEETGSDDDFKSFMSMLRREVFKNRASPKDRELYSKLNNWLVDRKEEKVTLDFSATDHNRIATNIIQRLREEYQEHRGICPVCSRPDLLDEKLRLDTNTDKASEKSEMAVVGLPYRPSQDIPD